MNKTAEKFSKYYCSKLQELKINIILTNNKLTFFIIEFF